MSVLLLKTRGVIQTLGPVEIDPYWLRRGLQMVVDNGRVVFNREVQKLQPTTVTGGPKSQVSKFGRAMGFGPTYGLGTTDSLAGSTLAPPTTGKRSIVAELNPKTSGGGTLGRVFQDASGSGLARGESFYLNAATGIVYAIFVTNAGGASQWPIPTPPALDTWSVVGFSVEFVTSAVTPGYGYINGKFVASGNNIAVAGTLPGTNPTTDLVLGNRASDGIRGWDGMQGLILIFDGFLEAKDHASLAMNRRQVFLESRAIWVGASSASGSTGTVAYTNANDTSAASGTTTVLGTLARTNGNDTSAAAGTTTVLGTLATTNADDTSVASGTVGAGGSTGTVAVTNANDTAAAAGTTTVTGASATTNANDSVSAAGWVGSITGTLARANSNDTAAAYGVATGSLQATSELLVRRPKKVYIRRRGNILLFDTAEQADAYIEAEEQAQAAIDEAKSRGAKKRLAARVLKDVDKPEEVISIGALERVIDAQQLPFDIVSLLKQQDYQRIAQIQREIEQMLDEEEEILLLLA